MNPDAPTLFRRERFAAQLLASDVPQEVEEPYQILCLLRQGPGVGAIFVLVRLQGNACGSKAFVQDLHHGSQPMVDLGHRLHPPGRRRGIRGVALGTGLLTVEDRVVTQLGPATGEGLERPEAPARRA